MNKIFFSLVMLLGTSSCLAEGFHTITTGYAHTNGKSQNLDGGNVKYGYQFDDSRWGIISSLTGTTDTMTYTTNSNKRDIDISFGSFMLGPSYSFSNYAKLYVLAGITGLKADFNEKDENGTHIKGTWKGGRSPSAGLGLQMRVWKGLTLDASYEYSHFKGSEDYGIKNFSANTFIVGAGWMF
ncbi:MAG: Ail/Lom family outer membrane beta-barrel protein [Acinetobacter sp.]